jgi:hypothetical protein
LVKRSVEQFVSAPNSLLRSETERLKAVRRKALLKAEEEQLRRGKSKKKPSVEDILADMIRVASDKDTNPHWKFKALSHKRYMLYGHFPIEFLDREFGQFEHAKQVAGLADQPGTRAKKAHIAETSRREHASRYLTRCVAPYVRKPVVERIVHDSELILSISDTHATFLDPFTWYTFLSTCRDLQPDKIIANGDIMEGSEISRFMHVPGWTIPLRLEFEFAREMFRQLREVCPDAEIIWTAGNHGLDRLVAYITQGAPAIIGLPSLKFDELAGVKEYNIKLAMGGTIMSPAGQEDAPPGLTLYDFYRVHHGTKLGATPALQELASAGRSGQSGHVHRGMVIHGTTEAQAGMSWMCTPMGCTHRAGRAYMKGTTTGWQRGFGVAFILPGQRVHQYPVVTEGDMAIVEGHHYSMPRKFRKEQDVRKNWLKGWSL